MTTIQPVSIVAVRRRRCLAPAILLALAVALTGSAVAGQQGVAATAHPLATDAALQMLARGGNAVDAAVAAAFAIGVVEPDGSGLGGGGCMVVYLHDRRQTFFINYYHQAPADPGAITFDAVKDRNSAKAVLVPGTVAGLCLALEEYGTLPLSVVIEPALRYARDGFPVDVTLAGLLLDNMESLAARPELAEIFLTDGFPKMEGDELRQPQLARVLELIAAQGPDGFYRGETAEALAAGVTARGGVMTVEDLANYKATSDVPVRGTYRGLEIVSAPPPQSGVTLIEIMNMIELLEFDPEVHYTRSAGQIHMMSEIFRRCYADRSQFLGDPRFVRTPVTGLTSKQYAGGILQGINRYRAEPRNYRDTPYGDPGQFDSAEAAASESRPRDERELGWEDDREDDPGLLDRRKNDPFDRWNRQDQAKGAGSSGQKAAEPKKHKDDDDDDEFDGGHTTHLSVIDADSNMVALTQTLGNFFGSKVMINGVLLNNGRVNFSGIAQANLISPDRRPRSSITPTLVFRDGAPYLSLGSPGAGRIIATVAEILVNLVDYGMDLQAANDAPRFFCQKFDDYLYLESRIDSDVAAKLTRMGHSVRVLGSMDLFFGGVHMTAILPGSGELVGSADPRRGGSSGGLDRDTPLEGDL